LSVKFSKQEARVFKPHTFVLVLLHLRAK